jgi:MFS transporter, putative metabolite:H+ symporter
MTKVGGVLIIAVVVVVVFATTPSIAATALIGAVPLLAGIIVLGFARLETRRRPLEEITKAEFGLPEQA